MKYLIIAGITLLALSLGTSFLLRNSKSDGLVGLGFIAVFGAAGGAALLALAALWWVVAHITISW